VNKTDDLVRRFGGQGSPPPHVQWDGKDERGLPLADGIYRYRLIVIDQGKRTVAGLEHAVEISTSGPQGSVQLVPQQAGSTRR